MQQLCKIGIVLLGGMLAGIFLNAQVLYASNIEPPQISATSAILIDKDSGKIYFQKNALQARHPASITKIMTAIISLEANIGQEEAQVTPLAAGVYVGSTLNLHVGDRMLVEDVIKAALLASANDSTVVLAEHLAGNHDIFLELMNAKAFILGLDGTNYVNTNGFSKPNHLSTAQDLANLARYCLANPRFAELVATKQAEINLITKKGKAKKLTLRNTNKFLNTYPGANGVKTGTTAKAGNCLLTSVKKDQKQLISVVLKSRNRYTDTKKLMDYGFSNEISQNIKSSK